MLAVVPAEELLAEDAGGIKGDILLFQTDY
jgi:hypothetical protein